MKVDWIVEEEGKMLCVAKQMQNCCGNKRKIEEGKVGEEDRHTCDFSRHGGGFLHL